MPPHKPLEMKIELTVIEDLGIKLYTKLPSIMAEIVSNSWDADSKKVEMTIPEGELGPDSVITVEDWGLGMTYEEIQDLYLRIGRKRREEDGIEKTPSGRPLMGRKGIGKLSVFGAAKIVEIDTVKNHVMNSFLMNIDDILKQARASGKYKPKLLLEDKRVEKKNGTVVRLKNIKRLGPIDAEAVGRGIARHFSVLGQNFRVRVNEKEITSADKHNKHNMENLWEFKDEPIDSNNHPEWTVSGWIGTTEKPLDEEDRGVVIMARGKLLQTPTAFETKVGEKYSYSYLVGEINAEFLDEEEDLIATHRQSVVWESPQGAALKNWGAEKLKSISNEWSERRRNLREKVIREDPEFKEWLQNLPTGESKIADKVIKALTSSETLSDDRRKELAGFMRESFDQQVFQEMVNSLGDNPDDATLIEVFMEWDVIEAREILRLVKGRITTIEQFSKHVDENAREKPALHNFFKKWPWILDPTWTRWQDEIRYSKMLREKFPDKKLEEPDRRIDFVCIGVGDTVHVVELKRPGYSVKSEDFDQLTDYVEFVRENLGNVGGRGYSDVAGYIVAGKMQNDRVTKKKKIMSEGSRMYVKRYNDLIVVARQLHADFEKKLKEFEKRKESE